MPDQLRQGVELLLRGTQVKICSIRAHKKHLNDVNFNGVHYLVGFIVIFPFEQSDPLPRDDATGRGFETVSVV
jgi:hypothetical protein